MQAERNSVGTGERFGFCHAITENGAHIIGRKSENAGERMDQICRNTDVLSLIFMNT